MKGNEPQTRMHLPMLAVQGEEEEEEEGGAVLLSSCKWLCFKDCSSKGEGMRNPSKTQQPFTMFEHSSNQCLRVVVPTRAFSNIEIIHVNNSQTISYTLAKAKVSEFEVCFLDNV